MQSLHPDSPLDGWWVPVAQPVHSDAPVASVKVPAAHGDGCSLLVPQLLPTVHSVHCASEPRSVALE